MAQINLDTLPKSRKEAQALSSKFYFTGKVCPRGHTAARWTCNTDCADCKKERSRAATALKWRPRTSECLVCGATIQSELKPGRSPEFCSEECRSKRMREHRRSWETANPEARKRQVQLRLKRHRDERTQSHLAAIRRHSRYISVRRQSDPSFRLAMVLRNRLWNAMSNAGSAKGKSASSLIGCSISDLCAHLEAQFQPGMTWDSYGRYGWHIDHIIPCASFDLTDPEQQKACFHYTNLQPLWAEENLKKGASRS